MHIFQFVCTQYMCLFCVLLIFHSFSACVSSNWKSFIYLSLLSFLFLSLFELFGMRCTFIWIVLFFWDVMSSSIITTQQKYRTQNLCRIKWKKHFKCICECTAYIRTSWLKSLNHVFSKRRNERSRTAYDSIFYTCINISECVCVYVGKPISACVSVFARVNMYVCILNFRSMIFTVRRIKIA